MPYTAKSSCRKECCTQQTCPSRWECPVKRNAVNCKLSQKRWRSTQHRYLSKAGCCTACAYSNQYPVPRSILYVRCWSQRVVPILSDGKLFLSHFSKQMLYVAYISQKNKMGYMAYSILFIAGYAVYGILSSIWEKYCIWCFHFSRKECCIWHCVPRRSNVVHGISFQAKRNDFIRPNAVHEVLFPENIITVQYTSCL